jgi:casein kinase II subunit beta
MSEISWIKWFLSQPAGRFFIEIDQEYIDDIYNYYGLRQKISNFKQAFDLIHGPYIPKKKKDKGEVHDIDDYGICLYGLLHSRFLLTEKGIDKMYDKYMKEDFPKCPRTLCKGIKCLPCGPSDDMTQATIKFYCPYCKEMYHYDLSNIDGSFFGSSYIPVLLAKYHDIVPKEKQEKYVPCLFGFQLCSEKDIEEIMQQEETSNSDKQESDEEK